MTERLDLVGLAEVAQILGRPRGTIRTYRWHGLPQKLIAELAVRN